MVQKELTIRYTHHDHQNELSADDQSLLDRAGMATGSAYAPYSNFKVGVAIRTIDNKIVIGSNQENGAFPIGQCGERVALFGQSMGAAAAIMRDNNPLPVLAAHAGRF